MVRYLDIYITAHRHSFSLLPAILSSLHVYSEFLDNRFQKLGDNRDELTALQKFMVFYKSPISKFCLHSTVFVVFLLLYSYVVLFDFKYEMSIVEKLLLVWMTTYLLDELAEVCV